MPKSITQYDVVIIGAGPAALSAAIYTTREDLDTLVIEKNLIGGLAATTDWIDNYPGFAEGVAGSVLADAMRQQAERFGTKFALSEVREIVDEQSYKRLVTSDGDIMAKAVIIATGSEHKKLGIPGEDAYLSRGVHYCATCDGAFYRDKSLVVVGGGNSAVQEAIFLTRFATKIDLVVRSELRASDVLLHELSKHKNKIRVHLQSTPVIIEGNGSGVTRLVTSHTQTSDRKIFETDGVFIFIGLTPNTSFLRSSGVELDKFGMVKTNDRLETAVSGVFAAGDVRAGATMQIASAVGEGATAALRLRQYLEA